MAPRPVLLLDDMAVNAVLMERPSKELRKLLGRRPIYTTGLWYYRLNHALRSDRIIGALSGPLQTLSPVIKSRVVTAMLTLPSEIGLVSLRDLAPIMSALIERHSLNVLALEALAAATYLPAELVLSEGSENPLLAAAAKAEGVKIHVVPAFR
jgi:hypothetical protein